MMKIVKSLEEEEGCDNKKPRFKPPNVDVPRRS